MDKEENKKNEKQEPTGTGAAAGVQKERDEYLAGWQRARADFLNYKKEETERLAKVVQFANEDLIKDLLYVLDSFSLMASSLHHKDDLKPFLLIRSQLENALKVRGLEKIKTQKGEDFNPEVHEAVEADGSIEAEPHRILEVIADGYRLNGKLIRPAKVKVSK